MKIGRVFCSVAALGFSASCGDSAAPLEPTVGPVAAVTSLTTVMVSGRAEPLAEVSVQGGEA